MEAGQDMREKFLKKKGFRALAVIFMSVLFLLGVVQAAAASENSGSGRTTGSLSPLQLQKTGSRYH